MPGVVLARQRSTDGTLPSVTWPSTLCAHQRLRLCHRWITLLGFQDRHAGGEPRRREPAACASQLLRAVTMPRKETSAPTTKITTAR
jgi:hypothetical protein